MKLNLICLLIVTAPLVAAAEVNKPDADGPSDALSLDQVVNEVLRNNPSLKAARASWEAMKQRIPQARAWEDLRVGIDATVDRFVEMPRNAMTDFKYSAEQTLPLAGKNRRRGEAAAAEAAAAFEELRRRELDLTARARAACYRLANAYEQLAVTGKNQELLKQFLEISRAKYEVGKQSQADVLVAETDLGKLLEARFDIERQISEEQSRLNVLMNRPAQAPLGRPAGLAFVPVEFSLDRLQSMALTHRPELHTARWKIAAAKARWEAARRERIPDPTVRIEASQYNAAAQTISEVSAGFSINLPWFNRKKYKAAIAEALSMKESAEHELEALQTETLGMVRDQLKKVETFHHHTELFRDRIVPLAQQAVKANQVSYEADKSGFLDLIVAQRTALDAESMYWSHLTDYLVAVAELEAAVGTDPKHQTDSLAK